MKNLCNIVLFFVTVSTSSQNLNNTFLNQVYLNFVDSSFITYNLFKESNSHNIYDDTLSYHYKEIISRTKNLIPKQSILEIIDATLRDTSKSYWDCSALNKAICVNFGDDSLLYNTIRVHNQIRKRKKISFRNLFDSKETKDKIDRQQRFLSNRKSYNDAISKKPKHQVGIYQFSRPFFDKSFKFAIMNFKYHYGYGIDDGYGKTLLFKKVNYGWVFLEEISGWGVKLK